MSVGATRPIVWGSFNIRYDNPDDGNNNWKYRKDRVRDFIRTYALDVVGMQEVLVNQLRDLTSLLPEYDYVGVGRDDGHEKGEFSPIFYRKDKFQLLDSGNFSLSESPDSFGKIGWDAACARIVTWAKLRNKKNGVVVLAVNTHLDHVGVNARRNSVDLIIERIHAISDNSPIILTGDFNVSYKSEAYEKVIHDNILGLKDTYAICRKKQGVDYTFQDFGSLKPDEREKIDYVFISNQVKVNKVMILPENDKKYGILSDHNPVVTWLKIAK